MKPIPNFTGYFADKLGNIYSIRPYKRSKEWRKEPIKLTPQKQNNGYYTVGLRCDGITKVILVHHLILITFIGKRPKGFQACHGIGGKSDNSLKNLSWGSVSKNNKEDKKRDGTLYVGSKHHNSKLNETQAIEIKRLIKQGINNHSIANKFGVHHTNISCIRRGVTWVHV